MISMHRRGGRARLASRQTSLFLALFVLAAATVAGGVQLAVGHKVSGTKSLYPRKWAVGEEMVPVYFNAAVPAGNTRSRIINGADQWSRLGRSMFFMMNRQSIQSFEGNCTEVGGRGVGVIYWGSMPSALGEHRACIHASGPNAGRLHSFNIKFNSNVEWYRRTGHPGARQYDLWSVASHEFGHAAGSKHYKGGTPFCPTWRPDRHTMCKGQPQNQARERTLAEHDRHTFKRAYP